MIMQTHSVYLKTTGAIILFLVIVLCISAFSSLHRGSIPQRAASIQVGATKGDVERLLGEPDATFTRSIFVPMETWAFDTASFFDRMTGSASNRYRFARPLRSDVTVEFNSSGHVARVRIPVEGK